MDWFRVKEHKRVYNDDKPQMYFSDALFDMSAQSFYVSQDQNNSSWHTLDKTTEVHSRLDGPLVSGFSF